tara:strand:- start:2543 stop:2692 length:150 start_codon:yes stop_codon:yes gene_type:complete
MKFDEIFHVVLYFVVLICFFFSFKYNIDEEEHITITLDTIEVIGEKNDR